MDKIIYPKEDITVTPVLSPFICEITSSGTSWSKKWSDGWVEQGGYFSNLYNNQVTLITPMANTDYSVITSKYVAGEDSSTYAINAYSKTTTSFTVNGRGQGGSGYGSNAYGHWLVQGKGSFTPDTSKNIYLTIVDTNGKSWYKRYSNGWVEQGGECKGFQQLISLWIPMRDTNYTLITGKVFDSYSGSSATINTYNKSTTGFYCLGRGQGGSSYNESASGNYAVYGWGE